MRRHVFLTILLLLVVKIQGCTKPTFVNTEINISIAKEQYPKLTEIGIPTENPYLNAYSDLTTFNISGCINPDTTFESAGQAVVYKITAYGQNILILRENAVENLLQLSIVYFSSSKIKRIKKGAFFNLPKLHTLELSDNLIEVIEEGTFAGLKITDLDLSDNKLIFKEDGGFSNLPLLRDLNLEHNLLKEFGKEWFTNSNQLNILNLADNYIHTLHKNTFQQFKYLQHIDLGANKLQYIDKEAFKELEDLTFLCLKNNRLRKLQPGLFQHMKKLQSLQIHNNNLTYISNEILKELSLNNSLDIVIHANPWQCGCYQNILYWARRTHVRVTNGDCSNRDNLSCVTPLELPDLCLEDREEDLDSLYYRYFNYTCDEPAFVVNQEISLDLYRDQNGDLKVESYEKTYPTQITNL